MKKILITLFLLLLISAALVACEEERDVTPTNERFICIYEEKYGNYEVLVDTETNVQYLKHGNMKSAEWIVLVDENGKPLLYENN